MMHPPPARRENHIWRGIVPFPMRQARFAVIVVVALASLTLASVPSALASQHPGTYLAQDIYTEEYTTSNRDVLLEGDTVLKAWFNFTVSDDIINSNPDVFTFTVSNMDDASLTQSWPGTTDTEGRLVVSLPFTLEGSPRWRVSVSCTEAGDTMGPFGTTVIEADPGNAWDLQVEYVYYVDDGTNGNGGNGNGGTDGEEEPALVTLLQLNYLTVALISILVAFLAMGTFTKGGGSLKFPFVMAFILALDAFIFLPVALVVNQELNDAIFALPPFGPEWMGNLALILLVLWVIPFIVARKRVLSSDEVHGILSRVTAERAAKAVTKRAKGYPDDPLSDKMLALLMMVIGVASVAVVAMILLA